MSSVRYVLIFLPLVLGEGENNVCKSMLDYLTIDHNENCWHNPDVGSTLEQLITRRGYPLESYNVTTEDGYINIMYRIPHNNTNHNSTRQPILLHPGISGSPRTFLTIGNRSLAFFLVNNGFDVWLPNRRGTVSPNSKGHVRLSRQDEEFWNFSFHEVGYYDIKAEIEFINKETKSRKIILLGYSMGSTESYIYAILRKRHATKYLAGIISLSPIAYMSRSGGVVATLAIIDQLLESIFRHANFHAFFYKTETNRINKFRFSYEVLQFAKSVLMYVAGDDSSEFAPEDLPVYLDVPSAPVSIKTLIHFAQEVKAEGMFQYYDYGPSENLKLYNSTNAPAYNISQIQVPVYMFYGESDLMSSKEDVLRLYNELTVENKSLTEISQDKRIKFNHVDFTVAKDIEELLYKLILKTIKENLSG